MLLVAGQVSLQICETVCLENEGLPVVLGHDVENDSCDDEQQPSDDEHNCADQCGEPRNHAGRPEFRCHLPAENDADDSDNRAQPTEEGERFVLADHAENRRHDLHTIAHGVEFAYGAGGAVTVLDGQLVEAEIVVKRVDRHLRLDLEAAGQDRVGFHEAEGERAVPGHDVGDMSAEQAVD